MSAGDVGLRRTPSVGPAGPTAPPGMRPESAAASALPGSARPPGSPLTGRPPPDRRERGARGAGAGLRARRRRPRLCTLRRFGETAVHPGVVIEKESPVFDMPRARIDRCNLSPRCRPGTVAPVGGHVAGRIGGKRISVPGVGEMPRGAAPAHGDLTRSPPGLPFEEIGNRIISVNRDTPSIRVYRWAPPPGAPARGHAPAEGRALAGEGPTKRPRHRRRPLRQQRIESPP